MSAADAAPVPAPASAPAPAPARWLGLDALRGLAIAAMILVNNPGRWGEAYQYAPLRHAAWHGCTFTDLVFPTFLFCVGVAIVPALRRRVGSGLPRGPLVAGVLRRGGVLVLLGFLLHAFPFWSPGADEPFARLSTFRLPGVLQRLGVCYALAALLFVLTTARTQAFVLLGCLFGHWAVSTLVPVPGVGAPDLDVPAKTLQGWLDRAVFGERIYRDAFAGGKVYDPEGLLSTVPALATALFGVQAGRVLASGLDLPARVAALLRRGTLLLLAGAVWAWFLPLNKPLWTPSYAVWTAGVACCGLGLCVWAFEQQPWARWARPLQVYGVNALLVFVGSGVLGRITGSLCTVVVDGRDVSVKEWFFRTVLLPLGDPKLASFSFALLWVAGWYAVLAVLWRRGLVWKV